MILTDILGGKKKRKSFEKSLAGRVSRPKKRSSVAGSQDDASRKCLDGKRDFKDFRFQLYLKFLEWVDPTKRDVQTNPYCQASLKMFGDKKRMLLKLIGLDILSCLQLKTENLT